MPRSTAPSRGSGSRASAGSITALDGRHASKSAWLPEPRELRLESSIGACGGIKCSNELLLLLFKCRKDRSNDEDEPICTQSNKTSSGKKKTASAPASASSTRSSHTQQQRPEGAVSCRGVDFLALAAETAPYGRAAGGFPDVINNHINNHINYININNHINYININNHINNHINYININSHINNLTCDLINHDHRIITNLTS
ncbi:hypothetical protein MY11210_008990 [Beauveria gryllotalpidicola]